MLRLFKRGICLKNYNKYNRFEKITHEKVLKYGTRCVATQSSKSDSLFPERADFPNRHIGPRDQDIVTMLDLLGYKVC